MEPINPYNFVPLESGPDRKGYHGRLQFHKKRYSGMLKCTLKALTPLISIDQRNYSFHNLINGSGKIKVFNFLKNYQRNPIIQGSSLKGMIRSIYEAITDSCMTLACTHGKSIKRRDDKIKYEYQDIENYHNNKCSNIKELCPSCRLFGTINNDDRPCQGRVRFSDADLKQGELIKKRTYLKVLSNPKPHHHATYGKSKHPNGPIAGRKFYYHHGKDTKFSVNEHEARRSIAIEEYALVGTMFEFEVYLENLDKEEFEYFILALELYEGLGHKIGLGKAIGLGSCRITVDRDQSSITIGSERYQDWDSMKDTTWYSLKKEKKALPPALIEVLRLNKEGDDGEIGYPPDFRNYPNQPIDARGFFREDTKADKQVPQPNTAKTSERSRCPIAVATEPPKELAPKVGQEQEAAWLKEIYDDELVFVNTQGREIVRPRQACQGKKKLQEVGKWFVLWGTTASKRVLY